jgi:hypothetical protein
LDFGLLVESGSASRPSIGGKLGWSRNIADHGGTATGRTTRMVDRLVQEIHLLSGKKTGFLCRYILPKPLQH